MRPAWVDDHLFPFESQFLALGGSGRNVVHYLDEGRGPVLLMLHGNPTWSFVYRDVITALAGSFRCVALDYPGFGLSAAAPGYQFHPGDHAQVVAEFVDRLDLRDVTLVAQDWGGPIGVSAVLARRDRFSALALGNTWAWPVNGDLHSALPTPQRRTPSAVFPRDITAARTFLADLERGLPSLADLPALLIWGDADVAFRAKERQRWESLLTRHHTVVLAGAGHFVQSDAATDFADAIVAWWDRR